MELVSVVIPTHNSAEFIANAIDSVIAQTYRHVEIIVVDDGSCDNTVEVARAKLEKDWNRDWQVIELEQNGGPSRARNVGWRAARGAWIQFLDSDDWLAPSKFELQMSAAIHAPSNVAGLYSPWRHRRWLRGQFKWKGPLMEPNVRDKKPVMCLVAPSRPLLGSGLVRRTVLEEIGGLDESLRFWECEEVNFRIAQKGRIDVVPSKEPLYVWRLHHDRIYIGGPDARYQSTQVALGWIALILKATAYQPLAAMQLKDGDRKQVLDEATMWGRLLYAQDRRSFEEYKKAVTILEPNFRPTTPWGISALSQYTTYERAEAVCQFVRKPKTLARRALCKLKLRQQPIFDWG